MDHVKIKPAWWIGVIVYIVYNAIIYTTWAVGGADYTNLVGPDVAFKSTALPLALGFVFLVLALTLLGWWRPVLVEDRPGKPVWAQWPIIAVMVAMILIGTISTQWSNLALVHLLTLVAAGLLVGFNEEALTRGVLVVAGRGSFSSETKVWFFATALFGLMHLPNAFFGVGLIAGSAQVVMAFLAGCGFYVIRRVSGSLLLPMLLHGAWDFANFTLMASGGEAPGWRIYLQFGTYIISVLMVVVLLKRERHG